MLRFNLTVFTRFYHRNVSVKNSTIFALSSGYGKCGVAVIRISGPDSRSVLTRMAGFNKLPKSRIISLRDIKHPTDNNVLDRGLVIWFPGPNSFTGEDCCELQIHGGKAVISAVLNSLLVLDNFRPAQPGEFTKRAFYSNKLDLTEVEGLADLIDSETEAQRKQALNQMSGALSNIYNSWKHSLTKTVAQIEAYIDFSESENIEEDLIQETKQSIEKLVNSIQKHLADGRRGERLRDGVQTVILGAPNVGKSSLLNLLCRKDEAIVSSIAGTTRDIVTSCIDIGGYPLVVKDTAGLRNYTSTIQSSENSVLNSTPNQNATGLDGSALRSRNTAEFTIESDSLENVESVLNYYSERKNDLSVLKQITEESITESNCLQNSKSALSHTGETQRHLSVMSQDTSAGNTTHSPILNNAESALNYSVETERIFKNTNFLRKNNLTPETNTRIVRKPDISNTTDPIEIEGISRALNAAQSADLILLIIDPSHLDQSKPLKHSISEYCFKLGIDELISNCDSRLNRNNSPRKCLLILNKVDLVQDKQSIEGKFDAVISCSNSDGVENLLNILTIYLEQMCGRGDIEDISCNQVRHRHCLVEVLSSLETCLNIQEPDLIAHHIRQAMYSLGKITGHVSTEQILDVIFKQFCIGK